MLNEKLKTIFFYDFGVLTLKLYPLLQIEQHSCYAIAVSQLQVGIYPTYDQLMKNNRREKDDVFILPFTTKRHKKKSQLFMGTPFFCEGRGKQFFHFEPDNVFPEMKKFCAKMKKRKKIVLVVNWTINYIIIDCENYQILS